MLQLHQTSLEACVCKNLILLPIWSCSDVYLTVKYKSATSCLFWWNLPYVFLCQSLNFFSCWAQWEFYHYLFWVSEHDPWGRVFLWKVPLAAGAYSVVWGWGLWFPLAATLPSFWKSLSSLSLVLVLTVKNTSPAYGLDVRKFRLDQPLENVQPRSSCILSMAGSGLVSKDESDVQFQDLYRPPSLGHSCVILFNPSLGEFHVFFLLPSFPRAGASKHLQACWSCAWLLCQLSVFDWKQRRCANSACWLFKIMVWLKVLAGIVWHSLLVSLW